MKEINEEDAAKLVSMIYRPKLVLDMEDLEDTDYTVKMLIEIIEKDLPTQSESEDFGARMKKDEYAHVIEEIKASEHLMNMEIKNFEDNPGTYFRAMTLVDPTGDIKPVVVFRGTAGNYQWDDNVAGAFSSHTPSQMEAQKYIIETGLDHLTVDKVYSIGG